MNQQSLIASLCDVPLDRKILTVDDNFYTCRNLIDSATYIRKKYTSIKGKHVAIKLADCFEFISTLTALDGWAKSILFLPYSTNNMVSNELLLEAKSEYLISTAGLKELTTDAEYGGSENTNWILATSGTTGRPKLIYHNFQSLSRTIICNIDKGVAFRWGLFYDQSRFAGLQVILQSLIGGSLLITTNQRTFEAQINAAVRYKINALSATPSLWRKLLMTERSSTIPISLITLGGEIVDQSLLNQLKISYPTAKIRHIYASTEVGVGFVVNDGLAGFPEKWLESNQLPVKIKICDGRLFIKPKLIASGKEIQNRLDDQGFIDSGDCVELSNGRVLFKGRDSGAINIGGNKVQPEEVEMVIRQLSCISDVRIFGKENPILGQLICVDLIKSSKNNNEKEIKNEVIQYCKKKLDNHKVPFLFRFVDHLPMSFSGKIVRK